MAGCSFFLALESKWLALEFQALYRKPGGAIAERDRHRVGHDAIGITSISIRSFFFVFDLPSCDTTSDSSAFWLVSPSISDPAPHPTGAFGFDLRINFFARFGPGLVYSCYRFS
jgi:hypothetical protein